MKSLVKFSGVIAVLMIIPLLLTCSDSSTNAATSKKRVFISSDIAAGLDGGWRSGPSDPDDAFAVELLGLFDGVQIDGVAVLRGNNINPAQLFAANQIFNLTPGRWNGPILEGAVEALPTPDSVVWFGGSGAEETLDDLCINEGVLSLADLLSQTEQPVTILAIGPLTDIACLILNFPPELTENIAELVFLGGRAPGQPLKLPTSDSQFSDFNIAQDLRAAQIVLENSDIPVTFITFSLSSSALFTRVQVDSLQDTGCGERAQMLSRSSELRMELFLDDFDIDGLLPFDVNAAYYIAKPELFDCEEGGYVFVECTIGTPGVYDGADNPCAGHGPGQSSSLNSESEQVWTDASLLGESRLVRVCTSYVSEVELERFETGSIDAFCRGEAWTDL